MRPSSSSWNHYFSTSDFRKQCPVDQRNQESQGYYIRPNNNDNPECFQRYHDIAEKYNNSNTSRFEPSIDYSYIGDITFAPFGTRNNSGTSTKSDANSIAISSSDGASVCPTSTATREKSKNAARIRRSNENCEYKELSQHLPLPSDEKLMLDKASSIRLTTNFLKLRALLSANGRNGQSVMPRQTCLSKAMEEALDGFLLVLCGEGSILFISDTVKPILGLSKWEITGTKFVDIVKKEDQEEFLESLRLTSWEENALDCLNKDYYFMRRFVIRVKCLLSRSKSSLSCEGFKSIHFAGHIEAKLIHINGAFVKHVQNLIGVAHTLPIVNRISAEVKLGRDMFMFRAGLDLKLSYVDDQIENLTGYLPKNMMEKSLYDLIHCGDAEEVAEGHRMHKRQVTFKLFRLLCPHGGWVWIQVYAIILRGSRVSKSACIVGFANAVTSIQAANLKFALNQTNAGSEGSYEDEILATTVRRKRRCPVPDSESMVEDCTLGSHPAGEVFSTEEFNLEHYRKPSEYGTSKLQLEGGIPNLQEGAGNAVNLPTPFVVHSFMEQLSINTSSSTYPENYFHPLHFQHQY